MRGSTQSTDAKCEATLLTNQAVVGSGVYGPANGGYRAPRMMYAGMRLNFD